MGSVVLDRVKGGEGKGKYIPLLLIQQAMGPPSGVWGFGCDKEGEGGSRKMGECMYGGRWGSGGGIDFGLGVLKYFEHLFRVVLNIRVILE